MAATFIPALVIKHNNDVFEDTDALTAGTIMSIPTPGSGAVIDGDYWAVPINDDVVSGFNYIPCAPDDTDAPTEQSFHVFKLTNRFGNDVWVVRGKTTDDVGSGSPASGFGYIQAAQDAECCSDAPRTLPTDIPAIVACQTLCNWDADDKYFGEFGLPVLTGNLRYYPVGYYNDVLLTAGTSTGYATKDTLLTFLNSGTWGAIGTWTYDATANGNSIKVTLAAGDGTDVLCVGFITVNPSA